MQLHALSDECVGASRGKRRVRDGGGLQCVLLQERREGLLRAFHRAAINRIQRLALHVFRQRGGLQMALRRKIHVNSSAEDPLVTRLDLAVSHKKKLSWEH